MSKIEISVVIPAFNCAKHINRALDSVLSQSYKAKEVIVVDDGSTDDTKQAVANYGEQVKYIYQANAGASAARNTGILAAKYDWIAFLDADDEWLENRLEDQVRLLEQNPSLVWVASNYLTCLCNTGRQSPYTTPKKYHKALGGCNIISYYDAAVLGISGCTDTILVKRSVLFDAGLFRIQQKQANDLDLWWRIACRYPEIGVIAKPAAIYHMQVSGSITKSKFPIELYSELIERHRKTAYKHQKGQQFDRLASFKLKGWIRAMLFHSARAEDVHLLVTKFKHLFSVRYVLLIKAALAFPWLTEFVLRLISEIVRALNLRKRSVLPPDKGVKR